MSHHQMPLGAVLAHWRPGWNDLTWPEAVVQVHRQEPAKMKELMASVVTDGLREPVTLGSDNRVWDGHHRIAVACRLNLPVIPVEYAALGPCGMDISAEQCTLCGLPSAVHALWCPSRPVGETATEVLERVHDVFADSSRAWFGPQFWTAYAEAGRRATHKETP